MLAQIQDIHGFENALRLMQAGQASLWIGMFLTLIAIGLAGVSVYLKDERLAHAARRAQYALFLVTAFSATLLYVAIFEGYYFVNYVESVTENAEELGFKISALWASQQGSLLFWCLILTGFGGVFAFSQRHNRTDRRLPWTLLVLGITQFFFFFIMVSPTDAEAAQRSSPFSMSFFWLTDPDVAKSTILHATTDPGFRAPREMWDILRAYANAGMTDVTLHEVHTQIINEPTAMPKGAQDALIAAYSEGSGMNPQLHNYWIAIHPPMLYLGFVGFTIPFAYAVGSLLSGEVHEGWLKPIRLWTMASWGFLTVGIALGGLWAYEILGWGGYWAWDPVENASFIPWLTGTAFIHSVIVSERRGLLRMWSFALIIITYCMTVIGTFLVRSGIINSVHAFGATGDVDVWFYGFIIIVFLGSLLALVWRMPLLRSDRKLESLVSREGSFLFNNLVFLAIALVTLVITFWPWITEKLYGENGSEELGQNAFVMINAPLLLFILLLMGIGPALAWRRNNLKQVARAFTVPAIAGVVVGVINLIWLNSSGLLIEVAQDDRIAQIASWVRLGVQVTLWPICAFTLVCILMEFASGARARARGTGENRLVALAKITLKNRRRYGGYIVHLGVLLVALGIYYSSFYESEGTVIARPGGHSVLEDKLTGDKFLVYYESDTRTAGWDFMDDAFGRDEQTAQLYQNMLTDVKRNPDKTADEIVGAIVNDMKAQSGGELPPFFEENLGRMSAAVAWGVRQREESRVYENFDTTMRIFRYESPAELETAPYTAAHEEFTGLLFTDDLIEGTEGAERQAAVMVQEFVTIWLMGGSDDMRRMVMNMRDSIDAMSHEDLMSTGLFGGEVEPGEEELESLRRHMVAWSNVVLAKYDALLVEAMGLGAELSEVNRQLRRQAAQMPEAAFRDEFGLVGADASDYAARRFQRLKDLEKFHEALMFSTTNRRNEVVKSLALGGEFERLEALRPLSLTGLVQAREEAEDAGDIQREIDHILKRATTVEPGMRIFYDKRTGAPRMSEPVKDPFYYRTPARDVYFILQDAQQDGTATFRFFVKPQMAMGLIGLTIIVAGTVLAFLPAMRRRRPEVA